MSSQLLSLFLMFVVHGSPPNDCAPPLGGATQIEGELIRELVSVGSKSERLAWRLVTATNGTVTLRLRDASPAGFENKLGTRVHCQGILLSGTNLLINAECD